MSFNYLLGLQDVDGKKNIVRRHAVRAIIINKDYILMVHNNKGDYKFPGGGVKKNEKHEETLKREIKEETGYSVESVMSKLGVVTERNIDIYEKESVFEMISHYYLCKVSDKQELQQLDDYEAELDFNPIWITIDKAIEQNERLLKDETIVKNHWAFRETTVLKALAEYYVV